VLGIVEIKGDRLFLETNSKKRLEVGKKLLLKAMPDALTHKIDLSRPDGSAEDFGEKSK